jgi:ribose 5-phosphate isomerase A
LLREKIVAAASRHLIIVADDTKLIDHLGSTTPVPVEVVPFGWQATASRITQLGAHVDLRQDASGEAFRSDSGNFILDCYMGEIDDPADLDRRLQSIVGVVETGLFIGRTSEIFIAGASGVRRLTP